MDASAVLAEPSLEKILEGLTCVITSTGYWNHHNFLEDPEKIILEDSRVKEYVLRYEDIFVDNLEWFLMETFFQMKSREFSAILHIVNTERISQLGQFLADIKVSNDIQFTQNVVGRVVNSNDAIESSGMVKRALNKHLGVS